MKLIVILAFVIALVPFTSCQKEITGEVSAPPDTTGNNNSRYLIKTYTEDITLPSGHSISTFALAYDTNDRLKSLTSTSNPGDKFLYQYNADNTYFLDLYESNVLFIHAVFMVNSLQAVDSMLQYNDTQDTTTSKYIYNALNQFIQMKEYEIENGVTTLVNTTYYERDANGDVTKETGSNGVTTYEFYPDLLNTLNFGKVYDAKDKHLVKKTTSGGITVDHTYTFDALNRITSQKLVSSIGFPALKTYTY